MGGHAVYFVVRRHHANRAGFFDRFSEGKKKSLPQNPHGDVSGRAVHAGLRLPVSNKMLESRDHSLLVTEISISLKPIHGRDAQPRNQVRIFAVSLFDSSPTRISRNI